MKKALILFVIPLFLVAGNVAAADLTGTWSAFSECYGTNDGGPIGIDSGESTVDITQDGDFVWSENDNGEYCYGVIDGNKISMTCPARYDDSGNLIPYSFGYGELKGKTIHYISHVPEDGKTCKITVTRVAK